jgi:phosphohistidine phosphatase
MRIYLFRHGEALSKGDPSISSDAERPLVQDGIKYTRQAAEGLKTLNIPFDAIFTSPWLRARQTADIVSAVLGLQNGLEEMPELAGDHSIEDVMRAVSQSSHETVMLVGHNPQLSDLAAYLLSLSTGMQVDLKKSSACAVEVDRIPPKSPGTLLWMMTAKQLRALRPR